MLSTFRERFTGTFALILLALIAVSFVFFGLNYSFIGQSYAARVDGEEITVNEFESSYRRALQQNPQLASLEGPIRVQVRRNILDRLVAEQLIDNFLFEQGFRISDQQVVDAIRSAPQFRNDEGRFDEAMYDAWLAGQGLNRMQFEALQRNSLRQQQLQLAILATAVVTPAEYRRFLNLTAEQRVVTLATISQEDVADEIEITEDMIVAFYEDNPNLYQLPESVDVEYIEIDRTAVAENIEISEERLREYYEQNQDRFLQDEERRARHILILSGDDPDAAEARAEDVLARLNAGESFDALAAEVSEDTLTATQGGDFGAMTRDQYLDELAGPVFSMEEGELRGPIESEFGFHILRLDEILERGPLPLEEVRGDLLTELRAQEVEERFDELERALSDAIFETSDMQAIAQQTGLEVETASGITRSGGEPFGQNQAALDAIFEELVLEGGQVSEVTELDATSSAVFKVVEHTPARRQPLEDVRDQVEAALRAQQAEILLANRAEEMLEALASGEDFGVAAEMAGLAVQEPVILDRVDQSVDQSLLFEVFAAGKPAEDDPIHGRVRQLDGTYAVYSLNAVLPGRPEAIPLEERDAGKERLARESGIGDFQAFVQALYEQADIVVNDEVVAAETFQ